MVPARPIRAGHATHMTASAERVRAALPRPARQTLQPRWLCGYHRRLMCRRGNKEAKGDVQNVREDARHRRCCRHRAYRLEHGGGCAGSRPVEDAERVFQQLGASGHVRRPLHQEHRARVGWQLRDQVLRAGRAGAGARMLRCRVQGLGRGLLDDTGLPHRQDPGARLLHIGALRAAVRRVLRLEEIPRWRRAQERDLRRARPVLARRVRDRPGDFGLVPQRRSPRSIS